MAKVFYVRIEVPDDSEICEELIAETIVLPGVEFHGDNDCHLFVTEDPYDRLIEEDRRRVDEMVAAYHAQPDDEGESQ